MHSGSGDLAVPTTDGVVLSVRRFAAVKDRKAVLICGHAMMANGSYFYKGDDSVVAWLTSLGVDCYVVDWRGHGKSVPPSPRTRPGHSFDDYVEFDLPAVVDAVAADARTTPSELAIVGHSLGGLVALAAIGGGHIPPPRRLVLVAASPWLEGPTGSRLRRFVLSLSEWTGSILGYCPTRFLRLGSDDESYAYMKQMSAWTHTSRWTSLKGVDYQATLPAVSSPTLCAVGAWDMLCRPEDAQRLCQPLPNVRAIRVVGHKYGDGAQANHFSILTNPRLRRFRAELASFVTDF